MPAGSLPPVRAATSMFLISLAKSLPRRGVDDGLLVLGRRPLGVAGHLRSPSVSGTVVRTARPSRRQRLAHHVERTARAPAGRRSAPGGTRLRAAGLAGRRRSYRRPARRPTRASTSTSRPTALDPWRADEDGVQCRPVAEAREVESASNESTCRPNALRRTVTSSPPIVCWPSVAALEPVGQHDHAGARAVGGHPRTRPLLQRLQHAEPRREPPHRGRLAAGDDKRIHRDRSASVRTTAARAPTACSAARCSRKSPCRASTPMIGSLTQDPRRSGMSS